MNDIEKEIEELEKIIKPITNKIKELKLLLKEKKEKNIVKEIESKIRVGSEVFIPLNFGGSGYKLTITRIKILEEKNKYFNFTHKIQIEGITKSGKIFKDYICPYVDGNFIYDNCQEYGRETKEIIIKKY